MYSEFVNRYSRYEFHIQMPNARADQFKNFRKSPAFKPVAIAIADAVGRIMKHSIRVGDCFPSIDIEELLSELENQGSDFNDVMLVEICKTKNLKLLTDDADFKSYNIPILTGNKKLLN